MAGSSWVLFMPEVGDLVGDVFVKRDSRGERERRERHRGERERERESRKATEEQCNQ